MEVWIDWSSSCGDYSNNRKRSSSSYDVVSERRIGERLSDMVQRQEKINAQLNEMFKAVKSIKDRLQGSGGATAMVDDESNRESLVEEDDLIVQLRNLKQVSHIQSYIEAFDELNSRAGIEEDQALSYFLSGLIDDFQRPVRMFRPKTLSEAYSLAKLQELTVRALGVKAKGIQNNMQSSSSYYSSSKPVSVTATNKVGIMNNWNGGNKENEVDYSMKDNIRKLDSEVEDETYADEEIDLKVEIDAFEEEEADWNHDIEKETECLPPARENAQMKELVEFEEADDACSFFCHLAVDARSGEILDHGKVNGIELEQDTLKGNECISYARQNAQVNELYYSLLLPWLLNWFPRPTVKLKSSRENVLNTIRDSVDKYESAHVIAFENMRILKFKGFKEKLKSSSRFFLGSNKVMQVALGRSASDEIRLGLHKISKLLRGDAGLFLTNLPKEEVKRKFEEYEDYDFARTGTVATEKVELNEGPLDQFTHEMEPFLRKQGRLPSARRNASLRELAVTLNAVTKLTRLPVRYPKPLVKMKFMVVPIDSCRVFKGGGATHTQVQCGEVICGELGKLFDRDKGRLQKVTRGIHADVCDGNSKFADDSVIQTFCSLSERMKEPNVSSSPALQILILGLSGGVLGVFCTSGNIEDIGGLEWFLASSYASSINYRSLKRLSVRFPRPMVKMKLRRYPDMGESCIEAVMLSKFLCFEASRAFGVVARWFSKPRVKMKLEKIKHEKLGSMIPCGQGILRGRDCYDHNCRREVAGCAYMINDMHATYELTCMHAIILSER